MRLRRRPGWRTIAVAAVLALPVAAVAAVGQGNDVAWLDQNSGTAWVMSPSLGLLSLIDGTSEEVVAAIPAGGEGHAFEVEQAGSSAYVVDQTKGTVARVDGANLELARAVALGSPDAGVRVMQGGGDVVVIDPGTRTARRVDARTLQLRDQVSLAAAPGPEQSVVDGSGRLWVVDAEQGGLTWYDSEKHTDADAADADTRIVLVRDRPVLVDAEPAGLRAVSPSGDVGTPSCLEVRPDDEVQLLGSRTRDEVFAAVATTGAVVVAGVGRDDCGRVIPVADPGAATFGPLAQSGRFVFVPNTATGVTKVIDTARDTVVKDFALADAGHAVELIPKDGLVFYNDLGGSEAGVLSLENGVWRKSQSLVKYDPATGQPTVLTQDEAPAAEDPEGDAPEPDPVVTPTPTPTPTTTPTAQPSPEPSSSVPAKGAPSTGGRPEGTTPSHPPDAGPVVGSIVLTPAQPLLGQQVAFTAGAENAGGATWSWVLSVASGAQVARSSNPGGFTATLPTDDGLNFVVSLTVSGSTGTASAPPLAFTAADPNAPSVAVALAATTVEQGQPVTATGTVTNAPSGRWTWSVSPGSISTQPGAGQPLTFTAGAPGAYTLTLTVASRGQEASASTSFTVLGPCTVTTPDPDIELLPDGGWTTFRIAASEGCLSGVQVELWPMYGWIETQSNSFSLQAGDMISQAIRVRPSAEGPWPQGYASALSTSVAGVPGLSWNIVVFNARPQVMRVCVTGIDQVQVRVYDDRPGRLQVRLSLQSSQWLMTPIWVDNGAALYEATGVDSWLMEQPGEVIAVDEFGETSRVTFTGMQGGPC